MSLLPILWAAKAKKPQAEECIRLHDGVPRLYFKVTDGTLASGLRNWYDRYRQAEQEITDYLKTATMVIGGEVPHFTINDKGRVDKINFRFAFGFHDGWQGISNTNWLVPESDEVKKAVASLPAMPSHGEVNKLLNWPEVEFNPAASHVHVRGYKRFAVSGNRQLRVSVSHGDVYVSVPHSAMYADVPGFCEQAKAWKPPSGLELISTAQGAKIERFNNFTKSPLGRVIGRALQKGLQVMP